MRHSFCWVEKNLKMLTCAEERRVNSNSRLTIEYNDEISLKFSQDLISFVKKIRFEKRIFEIVTKQSKNAWRCKIGAIIIGAW